MTKGKDDRKKEGERRMTKGKDERRKRRKEKSVRSE